jgi:hypothetical protein
MGAIAVLVVFGEVRCHSQSARRRTGSNMFRIRPRRHVVIDKPESVYRNVLGLSILLFVCIARMLGIISAHSSPQPFRIHCV